MKLLIERLVPYMPKTVTKILPTNPDAPVKYKTPGKLQVVVYSRVIKYTGAGVQIPTFRLAFSMAILHHYLRLKL
ncbi:MAG: hypothetical protein ACYCWE_22225 [Eubacteriales bacterium]